jgi:hypothetical protein
MVEPRSDGRDYDVLIRFVITRTDVPIRYTTKHYTVKYADGWTSDGATFQQINRQSMSPIGAAQEMGSCRTCAMRD